MVRINLQHAALAGVLSPNVLPRAPGDTAASTENEIFPYRAGFPIQKVVDQAIALPTHSWEYGATTQALLELYNPELSVFGKEPFPVPKIPDANAVPALKYMRDKVRWGNANFDALDRGNGAAGDPASMGVGAILLGQSEERFKTAASKTVYGLLREVPRMQNGAISHRANVAEVWADFMYMVPPFLAYHAANTQNETLLRETFHQCIWYREILQPKDNQGPTKGIWQHIIGPQSHDAGFWASGNGWAAAGLARVLATTIKSAPLFVKDAELPKRMTADLTRYIKEIIDGAIGSNRDTYSGGLLRNYLTDTTSPHGFGEISGSSLLAATALRMVVLAPEAFSDKKYITFAEQIMAILGGMDADANPHILENGIVTPAVNPLAWKDTKPFTSGSPEGNAFVVLLYAAWRDCIKEGICERKTPARPTERRNRTSKCAAGVPVPGAATTSAA